MDAGTWKTISQIAIFTGTVLAALGGLGSWYFGGLEDEAKRKAEAFAGRIESVFSVASGLRILEIGDSGSPIEFAGPPGSPLFKFFDDSKLTIEKLNGQVLVSTRIRDRSGRIVAELIRNEWAVARPPATWDRNYGHDALEVRDAFGDVVLQVRVVGDRAQIQGKWYDATGEHGVVLVKSPFPNLPGGLIDFISPGEPHRDLKIVPMFRYPSEQHMDELAH